MTDTTRDLLDYFALVKEIAESEGLDMDSAAERAAVLWPHLHSPAPRIEAVPIWPADRDGLALTA